MEISIYSHWVKSGSVYSEGLALYQQYGKSDVLKKIFSGGDSYYNRKKLAEELQGLSFPAKQFSPPIADQSAALKINLGFKSYQKPREKINVESLPEVLREQYLQLGPIIREISFLNSRLDQESDEIERGKMALRIVELSHERRGIYTRLDYFRNNGQSLADLSKNDKKELGSNENELEIFRLKNERKLLATQRSKLKNKPNKQDKLNKVVERIEDIDALLKTLV